MRTCSWLDLLATVPAQSRLSRYADHEFDTTHRAYICIAHLPLPKASRGLLAFLPLLRLAVILVSLMTSRPYRMVD